MDEQLVINGDQLIERNQELSLIYTEWDENIRTLIQAEDAKIDFYKNQADMIIIGVGKSIKTVRDALRHNKKGGFEGWIEKRHDISRRQAYNLINVVENINCATVARLETIQFKALYLLASPSTPEPAREEALDRASQGEQITHATAKEIAEKHKIIEEQQEKISSLESQIKSLKSSVLSADEKEKHVGSR